MTTRTKMILTVFVAFYLVGCKASDLAQVDPNARSPEEDTVPDNIVSGACSAHPMKGTWVGWADGQQDILTINDNCEYERTACDETGHFNGDDIVDTVLSNVATYGGSSVALVGALYNVDTVATNAHLLDMVSCNRYTSPSLTYDTSLVILNDLADQSDDVIEFRVRDLHVPAGFTYKKVYYTRQ